MNSRPFIVFPFVENMLDEVRIRQREHVEDISGYVSKSVIDTHGLW